MSVDDFNQI
jgi:dynein heavy chain